MSTTLGRAVARFTRVAAFAIGTAPLLAGLAAAQPTDARAAALLAANCSNCHGTHGRAVPPMPSLAGMPQAQIELAMRQFRAGERPATVMHPIAKGYSDEQIAAIAAYFAAQTSLAAAARAPVKEATR